MPLVISSIITKAWSYVKLIEICTTSSDIYVNKKKYHYKGSGENLVKFSATISELAVTF